MILRPAAAAAAGLALGLAAAGVRAQGPVLEHRTAVLQGLDKVTARVSPIRASIGVPTYFGTLEIVARACRETPPTEPPESAAFLEVRELPPASEPDAPPTDLFGGWMFASSPAVSALQHPVYDVWVIDCEDPVVPPEGAPGIEPGPPPADAPASEPGPPSPPAGPPVIEPSPPPADPPAIEPSPPPADAPAIEPSPPSRPAVPPSIQRSPLPPLGAPGSDPGAPPQDDQGVEDGTAPPSE